MRHGTTFAIAVLLVGGLGLATAGEEGHGAPAPPEDARLDFLKGLAGQWVSDSKDGEPGQTFEFRVTAGGHAVEEREMIGTPMEMVTVYHVEGPELVANHYCMLGNRPRLRAAERIVDGTLAFSCAGTPGGARSHDEEHVHAWKMRLEGDDRLVYSAELVREGKVTESHSLVLTRQRTTASR